MNSDFTDVVRALTAAGARFLVVGAHALAVHGVPRATGDLDIWVEPTAVNAERVLAALRDFGAPVDAMRVTSGDLTHVDRVVQIGLPPRRVDLLTHLSGLDFAQAWNARIVHEIDALPIPFLGRAELVRNKRATARLKDLADLEALGETP